MRNLKKLLAVVVAICVLASFTLTAFAAEPSYVNGEKAQKLYDLKLFSGTSTSTFVPNLGGSLTREQGILLLIKLLGKEADALAITDADTVLAKFSDYKKVSPYAKKYVAFAVKTGLVVGTSATTVGAQDAYTGNMICAIILRELGYTVEFDKSMAALAEKKVLTADNATKLASKNLIRDDAVGIMFAALQAADTKNVTIIAKLVAAKIVDEAKAIAAGVITAAPAKPEVASATADNLKVAKIVFNKEIDSTTINTSNVKATGIIDAKLGADKKTVYAIMPLQKQSTALDFTIENVKDTAGNVVPKTVKSVSFVDTTVPVINGVVAKNAKTLEISSSEPLDINMPTPQVISNVKVDGISLIGSAVQDFTKNTITIKLTSAIAAGTHKVEVSGFADYATYKAVTATFNIEVVEDKAAPVITSAKVISTTKIEVTFNELVDENALGSFIVNGTAVASRVQDTTDGTKIVLTLDSAKPLDIGATVEIKIEYKDQADVVGNKVAATTVFTFKVADDTTLPTVTAAIDTANKITLTFSKSMAPAGTIKIYKGTATAPCATITVIDSKFKTGSSNTIIELSAADAGLTAIDPTDVKVNITGMKDGSIRANVLAEQNITLKAVDTKQPTVSAEYLLTLGTEAKDDTVTFYFSEAMDTTTLNALGNYILNKNGTVYATLATYKDGSGNGAAVSSVAADAKSIVIKVPDMRSVATPSFSIYGLKDAAGNYSVSANGITAHTVLPLTVSAANAVSTTKIDVVFSNPLATIDPSSFKVTKNGADFAVVTGATIDASTPTKASLTISMTMPTEFATDTYRLVANNYSLAKDIYGTAVTSSTAIALTDKVAPTATVAAGTTAGAIVVTFSENVTVADKATLLNTLFVRKAGALQTIDPANVTFLTSADAAATADSFKKVVIQMTAATEYTVEILNRNITDGAPANVIAELAKTTVTTK